LKKYLAYFFIVGLLMLAAVQYARAEYPPIETGRLMTGVFCNTPQQIKTVLENRKLKHGALDLVNSEKVECVLHEAPESFVMVKSMRFIRADTFGGLTLYLYEAEAVGFLFGGVPTPKIEPVKLYVYVYNPVDPSHKSEDA
jgi:hypothetical protein